MSAVAKSSETFLGTRGKLFPEANDIYSEYGAITQPRNSVWRKGQVKSYSLKKKKRPTIPDLIDSLALMSSYCRNPTISNELKEELVVP